MKGVRSSLFARFHVKHENKSHLDGHQKTNNFLMLAYRRSPALYYTNCAETTFWGVSASVTVPILVFGV